MRVTRFMRDEGGATMVIVALCMTAMLGMVVLVVDVGGLLTLRRQMVTTSDAAALAAAQSCGLERPWEAEAQADSLATANRPNATRTMFETEDCGISASGRVRVRYQSPKKLVFAPILGAPDSADVPASASAIWGPAGGITPVPIEFSVDDNGQIPCVHQEIGTQCNYWHDNSADHDLGNSSNWGFMNLKDWDVEPDASCSNSGTSDRRDWITGALRLPVKISGDYALVCVDSGHSSSSWYTALRSQIGKVKYFPINDPTHMVHTGGKEKYAVIGFAALQIDDVLKGNDPAAVGTPGESGRCSGSHSFKPNDQFDVDALGCYTSSPQSVTNLELSSGKGGKRTLYEEGVHYTFDPVTHVITWFSPADNDVSINFDYAFEGVAGECGSHDPDPNAVCIVTSWQGARVGGINPGGGEDFGLRAVRLDG